MPLLGQIRATSHRGITLVVVLILLVIMSLTAAVAMRSATTQEKVVNNFRQDFSAQSLAEFALAYCEAELIKPSGDRVAALQQVEDLPARTLDTLQWSQSTAWMAASSPGGAAASTSASATSGTASSTALLTLGSALVGNMPSPPQCLVERLSMDNGSAEAVVVTARGFSLDYRTDSSGQRTSGSAVWLQSFLYFD